MSASQPLVPWSSPVEGTPGWRIILLPARRLAVSLASAAGGAAQATEDGHWQVIIRRADLEVTALDADDDTLTCSLPAGSGTVLTVRRRRWGSLETLTAPAGLPSPGVLTVRRFFTETRMGTLSMAPVPVFTAAESGTGAGA